MIGDPHGLATDVNWLAADRVVDGDFAIAAERAVQCATLREPVRKADGFATEVVDVALGEDFSVRLGKDEVGRLWRGAGDVDAGDAVAEEGIVQRAGGIDAYYDVIVGGGVKLILADD